MCIALCTIDAHNIAQNRADNFPSYPPDYHHCSDDVYLREGGGPPILEQNCCESVTYASEDHLKWNSRSGGLGSRRKLLVEGVGASPPEDDDTFFCENTLFCHGFKNDVAIFAFIAYRCSI